MNIIDKLVLYTRISSAYHLRLLLNQPLKIKNLNKFAHHNYFANQFRFIYLLVINPFQLVENLHLVDYVGCR